MSLKHTILGYLSWKPLTGYQLKKLFVESPILHWSGNNNQIYKSLLDLHKDGYVTKDIKHQEQYPAQKIYTISTAGMQELKRWSREQPDTPHTQNLFLLQLIWSGQLEDEDLKELLAGYEHEVEMQLLSVRERFRRGGLLPERNSREMIIAGMVGENVVTHWENELGWIRKLQRELF